MIANPGNRVSVPGPCTHRPKGWCTPWTVVLAPVPKRVGGAGNRNERRLTAMKQLWTKTSNGIGLFVIALGVILADNRGSTDIAAGRSPTGTAR